MRWIIANTVLFKTLLYCFKLMFAGVCVARGSQHYSGGQASSQLTYNEGALSLQYNSGATCEDHTNYK